MKNLLQDKKGDEAVSFLLTTAMLVFIFATLVSALIYIMQYYNASYICRRVIRKTAGGMGGAFASDIRYRRYVNQIAKKVNSGSPVTEERSSSF